MARSRRYSAVASFSLETGSHAVFLFVAIRVLLLCVFGRVFARHSTNQNQALLSINTSKESLENYSDPPPTGAYFGRRRVPTMRRGPGIRSSLLASRAHRIGKWVDRAAPPSILAGDAVSHDRKRPRAAGYARPPPALIRRESDGVIRAAPF